MSKVLIVYHTISGNTEMMAKALEEGARKAGAEVVRKRAFDATLEDLLGCDAVAIGTADYFSYMAGAVKDFFDRTFYPSQGKVSNKPCVIFATAGGGGRPAVESVARICQAFKFKNVAEPVVAAGKPSREKLGECRELGKALVESL